VRSGAVVRCPACENKYRIKSAHFQREVHTGPRTLDETDSVLRSDSVDIDPDEVSPVSIDDEGNVVGLSGLSELMRWSDNQDQSQVTGVQGSEKSAGKTKPSEDALPQAKAVTKKTKPPAKAKRKPKETDKRTAKERARAIKRKKRDKMVIALSAAGVVVLIIAIVLAINLSNQLQTIEQAANDEQPNKPDNESTGQNPIVDPDKPQQNPQTNPDVPEPDEVRIFSDGFEPSPNPLSLFQPPWTEPDLSLPPSDVPTVLTPAKHLTHEGWYIMNPPRGAADASGLSTVELGQITALALPNNQTQLAGSVANKTGQAVERGELHIMLLDSTGNVFAETFMPLAMIEANNQQPIGLTIPTRYWQRSRAVRAGVQVEEWSDPVDPLQGMKLSHTNLGPSSAVRVSIKHTGDRPLRGIKMLLCATDSRGSSVANFLVEENGLYIDQGQWLDLVIATPLPTGRDVAEWSALMQKK
jgi:cytoskeletal protein RodZ